MRWVDKYLTRNVFDRSTFKGVEVHSFEIHLWLEHNVKVNWDIVTFVMYDFRGKGR